MTNAGHSPPAETFKRCACGRTFSREAWTSLPLVGYQLGEGRFGDPVALSLRNCSCGSTLSVYVDRPDLERAVEEALSGVSARAPRTALRVLLELQEAEIGIARREAAIAKRRLSSARRET